MFMGEYSHNIDAKGRMIVPSKFREQLGDEFVVTKGLDGCLLCTQMKNGRTLKKNSATYHLPRKMQENSHVSSLQEQQPVKWTSREEFFFRQC